VAGLGFRGVSKVFPGGAVAVDRLDLEIQHGEFMVFVGPSGSGKTTVLRLTAGLEELTEGEIVIGDRLVNDMHPMDRDIAMVFQNYALYPHMTVAENMGFGLKLHKVRKPEIKKRVHETAHVLGISQLLSRKPAQLSGGQRQRVAMGRAIVLEPAAFLMDEPLSNLDAKLRVQMRTEIRALQHRLATTTIYVTHDQTEAMTMGDRVAVMRNGRLAQVDAPQVLYDRPSDLFVAGFIGSPAMNFLSARLGSQDGSVVAEIGGTSLVLPERALPHSVAELRDHDVIVGIRPENVEDAALCGPTNGKPVLEAPVTLAEPMGAEVVAHFELDVPPLVTRDTADLARDLGQEPSNGSAAPGQAATTTFTARLDSRSRAVRGLPMSLVIEPSAIYFFDPKTESALR
jgi:multiple sugar transport system ATP-binding protein